MAGGSGFGPRLQTLNPIAPIASEYAVLKDEVSLGRGEDNDIVIPHASVSRIHARLLKRNGAYELTDLNSTNGSFVDDQQIRGSTVVSNGSQVRLGDICFVLRY
jgi:pSer/pThr/pTyr-binding forkhead associated (FHA) protein